MFPQNKAFKDKSLEQRPFKIMKHSETFDW